MPATHTAVVEDEVGTTTAPADCVRPVRLENDGIGRRTGSRGDQRDAEMLQIDQSFLADDAFSFLALPNTAFSDASLVLLLIIIAVIFIVQTAEIFHERKTI